LIYAKALHPYPTDVGLAFPSDPETIYLQAVKPTRGPTREQLLFTPEMEQQMKDQALFTIIYAKITYLDIFGCDHWTHICQHSAVAGAQIPSGIDACASYNDADNNTCQPVTPRR
jgi:hypothetical protein